MLLANQRTHTRALVVRYADLQLLGAGLQRSDKLVENWALNINALRAEAHLSTVGETGAQRALDVYKRQQFPARPWDESVDQS